MVTYIQMKHIFVIDKLENFLENTYRTSNTV